MALEFLLTMAQGQLVGLYLTQAPASFRRFLSGHAKTRCDMGLNDRQFNDWTTLSGLVFCGLSRVSLARFQVSFLERCPIVRKITSYCILIISTHVETHGK